LTTQQTGNVNNGGQWYTGGLSELGALLSGSAAE